MVNGLISTGYEHPKKKKKDRRMRSGGHFKSRVVVAGVFQQTSACYKTSNGLRLPTTQATILHGTGASLHGLSFFYLYLSLHSIIPFWRLASSTSTQWRTDFPTWVYAKQNFWLDAVWLEWLGLLGQHGLVLIFCFYSFHHDRRGLDIHASLTSPSWTRDRLWCSSGFRCIN